MNIKVVNDKYFFEIFFGIGVSVPKPLFQTFFSKY